MARTSNVRRIPPTVLFEGLTHGAMQSSERSRVGLVATTSVAQPPGGGGPRSRRSWRDADAGKHVVDDARSPKEIDITDAQKTQMETLRADMQKDIRTAMSGFDFQSLRDMSQEERDKKIAELRTKGEELGKQIDAKVEKVLDEKQIKRLKQLQLQFERTPPSRVPRSSRSSP